MPLTDIADLMDYMETILNTAPSPPRTPESFQTAPKSESLIADPVPDLTAPPRSFAQVYGLNNNLLDQLAADAAATDLPDLASLLSMLDIGLRKGQFVVPVAHTPAPRLVRYVYPVV